MQFQFVAKFQFYTNFSQTVN